MPSLFRVGGYTVFFWSNENNEPVHVHVGKGKPSPNATKVWLTASGGCIIARNSGKIPFPDIKDLLDIIAAQHKMICDEWKDHFRIDEISFFC